jgi:hypothetical protein
MSLTGLASKGSGEITYAVVREALKVSFCFPSVTGAVDVACSLFFFFCDNVPALLSHLKLFVENRWFRILLVCVIDHR